MCIVQLADARMVKTLITVQTRKVMNIMIKMTLMALS